MTHPHSDTRLDILHLWLKCAHVMDSNQPAVVLSALGDTNFAKVAGMFRPIQWEIGVVLLSSRSGDDSLNALDYAAVFGLAGAFRLARETMILDEHHFRQTAEILVLCHHWELLYDVWESGEYDINACCEEFGSRTAVCELLSSNSDCPVELRRTFLQHPSTSMRCPLHDRLLGCSIAGRPESWDKRLEDIVIILERLYRDAKDGVSHPGRISVYPPPSRRRSHPPDILDVIAVFLQRAGIDLDAHITQMVPPEILLAFLLLPWSPDFKYFDEKILDVLQPYAQRPVDIPDASTSNRVPDTAVLADYVVPDTARTIEATDTFAMAESGPADNDLTHVPHREVLDDRVVPDTARAVEEVDTYRMTAVHLALGAAISLFVYLRYLQR